MFFIVSNPYAQQFTPLDLSGLQLWLDSQDNATITESSGDVSAWADKSPSVISAVTQGSPSQRPSLLDVSGRQMISFDGVDEYLSLADAGAGPIKFGSGDFSLFAVYRTADVNRGAILGKGNSAPTFYLMRINNADTNNGDFWCGIRDGSSNLAQIGADDINYNDGTTRLVAMVRDGNNLRQYQDGVEVSESPVDASAVGSLDDSQAFFIGTLNASSQWYAGAVGDILAFDRVLSPADNLNLTTFLKNKWGIS